MPPPPPPSRPSPLSLLAERIGDCQFDNDNRKDSNNNTLLVLRHISTFQVVIVICVATLGEGDSELHGEYRRT